MLIFMLLLNWFMSIIFIFLSHPLSLGFALLMQVILIALISGSLYLNFWFSYILFLIMIGGMLIMFIYMTSVASNEKFMFSKKIMIFSAAMLLTLLIISVTLDYFYSDMIMALINDMKINSNTSQKTMNKLYNYPNYQLILFLMSYLLITLIAVVKIVGKNTGTLRQK